MQALRYAGVSLLAGTDATPFVPAHGAGLHRELHLLAEAGFSPQDVLAAATSLPAHHFGLSDRGRINPRSPRRPARCEAFQRVERPRPGCAANEECSPTTEVVVALVGVRKRYTGRREEYAETHSAIAGLVSDRAAQRASQHKPTAELVLVRTTPR
ncbi:hypothetical protein [Streptomyces sp. NPDC001020]